MQISSGMREALAVGIGATLGAVTAGSAFVAITGDDAETRRVGGIIAGTALATTTTIGALTLRSPALRHDVVLGALGFVGLPSMITMGLVQNRRDA